MAEQVQAWKTLNGNFVENERTALLQDIQVTYKTFYDDLCIIAPSSWSRDLDSVKNKWHNHLKIIEQIGKLYGFCADIEIYDKIPAISKSVDDDEAFAIREQSIAYLKKQSKEDDEVPF